MDTTVSCLLLPSCSSIPDIVSATQQEPCGEKYVSYWRNPSKGPASTLVGVVLGRYGKRSSKVPQLHPWDPRPFLAWPRKEDVPAFDIAVDDAVPVLWIRTVCATILHDTSGLGQPPEEAPYGKFGYAPLRPSVTICTAGMEYLHWRQRFVIVRSAFPRTVEEIKLRPEHVIHVAVLCMVHIPIIASQQSQPCIMCDE